MDETLGDSLERSSGSALYLPESSEGPVGGGGDFSLGDRPYTFERRAVASTLPDAAPSQPPAARRERRGRRRRAAGGGCPGENAAEEEAAAAAVIQPPAAAASPPIVMPRRSRKRRRRASEARRRGEQQRAGGAPSSPPAADGRFPNVCPEPRHTQPPSSSSCSSSSLLSSSSDRGDESDVLGSLSFLTEEERAWLGAETEQSAPPPSSRDIGGEDGVRDPQVEGDALLARQLQEQFDWERRRLALPLPPSFAGSHRRRQPDHGEGLDTAGLLHHQAQSARTRQHRRGTRSSHDATEEEHADDNSNMSDLLPDSSRPCMTGVQWAAFSSLMNGNDVPTTAQPRGRGRGGGFRRGQQRGGGGGGGSGIEAGFLLLGQEDHNVYGALRAPDSPFEVPAAAATPTRLNKREINVFPTKTYDPAAPQGAGNTRCQICFCDYAGGEELRMLTCFHDYHAKCIDRWLRVNASCPVCRCSMAKRHSPRG